MQDLRPNWFEYRQKKQQELLGLLGADTELEALEEFLVDWMTTQFDLDQQTAAAAERWTHDVSEMTADLESTLSDEQRAELFDTISKYRSILGGTDRDRARPGTGSGQRKRSQLKEGASRVASFKFVRVVYSYPQVAR